MMEPGDWFALHDAERAEEYRRAAEGMTCLDCGRCVRSERHPDEGWCMADGEFRHDTDVPLRDGMECFEVA